MHWVTILMELDALCVQQLFKDVLNVTQVNNVLYVNLVIILICQIHVLNVQWQIVQLAWIMFVLNVQQEIIS